MSEAYSFVYHELIESYYLLAPSEKRSVRSAAEQELTYAELNKSRIFANSWGLSFVENLRSQVPAELQEQERLILDHQLSLQAELQGSLAGKGNRSTTTIKQERTS